MEAFAWFENSALSVWVRESPPVFPAILVLHALGMGCVVGAHVALGLRLLGAARFSIALLSRFEPFMWGGIAASFVSGLLLLAAYPAKALTNPVFYLKFALMGSAFAVWRFLRSHLITAPAPRLSAAASKRAAIALLMLWAGVITAGRLLAYTHHMLLASQLF